MPRQKTRTIAALIRIPTMTSSGHLRKYIFILSSCKMNSTGNIGACGSTDHLRNIHTRKEHKIFIVELCRAHLQ